jgi:4,5-DOPA dioxygenase extradiol
LTIVQPVLFVSHGATIFTSSVEDPTYKWFASLGPHVKSAKPRAIIVLSAHFVTSGEWAVTSSARPPLVHDHPVVALHTEGYGPPGDPALASEIVAALVGAGLSARLDAQRGLDHGAWLPLRAMVPDARVPVVMVSLNAAASFEQHIAVGAALAPFRRAGVWILGSGGVTHNQEEFRKGYFGGADPAKNAPTWSVGFDDWVCKTLAADDPAHRLALGAAMGHEDFARAHPTAEHFWPLLVAVGAASADVGQRMHAGFQYGLSMSAFVFGDWPRFR